MKINDIASWLNNEVRTQYNQRKIPVSELKTCIDWGLKAIRIIGEFEEKKNGNGN